MIKILHLFQLKLDVSTFIKKGVIQKAMHPNRIKKLLNNNISNYDLENILDNL